MSKIILKNINIQELVNNKLILWLEYKDIRHGKEQVIKKIFY
jgi:hypothetical protein